MNCTNGDLDLPCRRHRARVLQVWVHVGRRENRVCCELLPSFNVPSSCSEAESSSSLWLLWLESGGRFRSWCSSRSNGELMASHVGVGYACAWNGVEGNRNTGMKRGGRQQTKEVRPWWKRDRDGVFVRGNESRVFSFSLFLALPLPPDDGCGSVCVYKRASQNISTGRAKQASADGVSGDVVQDQTRLHARDSVMSLMTSDCLGPRRARKTAWRDGLVG
jgi:hypothetical protein